MKVAIINKKSSFTALFLLMLSFSFVQAQSDTMYVMKSGEVVGRYNVNTEVDSVIFYKPIVTGDSVTGESCPDKMNVFNDALSYGTVVDFDGNTYKTITIGGQEWMAENLRTSHYSNGDPIAKVEDFLSWYALTTPAYVWYDNDPISYECLTGKLYNGYTVTDSRKICPDGWHVPSDSDWRGLSIYTESNTDGGKMKSEGLTYWESPNEGATNEWGFSAIPSGYRASGDFGLMPSAAFWWSSSWNSADHYWAMGVLANGAHSTRTSMPLNTGFAIRCVNDSTTNDSTVNDSVASVGDFRDGGVVFWVDPTDDTHGLVCALEDQSDGVQWWNGAADSTNAIGMVLGAGESNTTAIITVQGAIEMDYAAGLARAYNGGGYTDWFLPSINELNEMYLERAVINTTALANGGGSFVLGEYWSSTEGHRNYALHLDFDTAFEGWSPKESTIRVRAIRSF